MTVHNLYGLLLYRNIVSIDIMVEIKGQLNNKVI